MTRHAALPWRASRNKSCLTVVYARFAQGGSGNQIASKREHRGTDGDRAGRAAPRCVRAAIGAVGD